ncbi:NIPSNAP protein [Mucilaginibacter frigoritolerans]|uniref:NIPSNAP protein n=1 Tax=Mucilaginibacter frigoritolerans TaxID=652788 RepID=A0A562TU95_9SPHI|nr:NIPSNAP family protein [Mucilaginibacter frigoritolerans]TWI97115.1 NIPSNAP protein [Mucilaginibacter frigoritolerans]
MKRRSFVKASLITTAAGAVIPQISKSAITTKQTVRQFYELRVYTLKDGEQQRLVEEYFANAFIPALNRFGSKHVGLFTELKPTGQTKLYSFIPYNSWDDFLNVNDKLAADTIYLAAGATYLNAPATAPAYERIESSLLKAFAHMPVLQVPEHKQRIFELRRYEHASEAAGKKKLEMFNDAGEIDIFKRLGFNPVFFGETIIGDLRPNLTYMVSFDDMAAHDAHWKAFGGDAEWKKISSIPDYADSKLVSRITSTFIVPAACSQI